MNRIVASLDNALQRLGDSQIDRRSAVIRDMSVTFCIEMTLLDSCNVPAVTYAKSLDIDEAHDIAEDFVRGVAQ